ncbi:Cell division protein FtsA [hydrothermal vent metagenome]|uniref:Cell division protein FtsA n=1 Tax=hydrothermal vent metagenome TaxID=652676 RepID=A0A1W1B9D3_9ZZZZ
MSKTVLAIDIGSTKICAIIAQVDDNKNITVTGAGVVKSQGLKKGTITNIELASRSIAEAVNDAKRVSGSTIDSAVVSISGTYTKSIDSSGIVNLTHKEVGIKDIERVMQTSLYNAKIPNEYDVLHALPYNFKVDEQDFIDDPLGMNASRLEVETHIITTQKSTLSNLKKALKGAGITAQNIILNGYASAIAVLDESEKELGVAVIDMGGTSCNLVIHVGNSIRYNDFLGVGSNHVTNDLSMALHTPLDIANKIKLTYGSLNAQESESRIEIPKIGDENTKHEVSLSVIQDVIVARVEETLMILAKIIENSGLKDQIGAGIVLTGGFAKMEGIKEYASLFFDSKPVRIAKPKELDGLFENLRSTEFSCAIGLIMHSAGYYTPYEIDVNKRVRHANEVIVEDSNATLKEEIKLEAPQKEAEVDPLATKHERMVNITTRSKEQGQNHIFNKFWNWATQLF